jgi:hypothetical protein
LKEIGIMMYCNCVLKMDANAKFVVNMRVWFKDIIKTIKVSIFYAFFLTLVLRQSFSQHYASTATVQYNRPIWHTHVDSNAIPH